MFPACSIAGNLPLKNANTVAGPHINRFAYAADYIREYIVQSSTLTDSVKPFGDMLSAHARKH